MNSSRPHGSHVGTASVLLIFTVLSIVSFATLTLVNSKADYNLSSNLIERQQAYNSACHKGNAFVAAVNSGYNIGLEDGMIEEKIPITDNQSLDIAIITNISNNSDNSSNSASVVKWQVVNTAEFVYDTTLPVMK